MVDNTNTETVNEGAGVELQSSEANSNDEFLNDIFSDLTGSESTDEAPEEEESSQGKKSASSHRGDESQPHNTRGKTSYQKRIDDLTWAKRQAENDLRAANDKLIDQSKTIAEMQELLTTYETAWQEIQAQGFSGTESVTESAAHASTKPLNAEDIKRSLKEELLAEQRMELDNERKKRKAEQETEEIRKSWEPHIQRATKEYGNNFERSFAEFVRENQEAPDKVKELMFYLSDLKYAPEVLVAVSKKIKKLNSLPFWQIAKEVDKLNTDITKRKMAPTQSTSTAIVAGGGKATGKQPQSMAEYRAFLEAKSRK